MATVTGLTAERMIAMEAATVIDGDVIGDNLHLTTRGGTDINAGNVRGAKGDKGDPGTPGTPGSNGIITSVNDQSQAAVYTPRVFANKAALDAWTTAPVGIEAFTTAEMTTWLKISSAWIAIPAQANFASLADLKSKFPTAPTGMRAYLLDTDNECIGKGGTWRWLHRYVGKTIGNCEFITYNASATAASSHINCHIHGQTITFIGLASLATAAAGGNLTFGTLAVPYRPSPDNMEGVSISLGSSTPGAARQIIKTDGSMQNVFAGGGGNGTIVQSSLSYNATYILPDLVPA